jgi:hypothetical protein
MLHDLDEQLQHAVNHYNEHVRVQVLHAARFVDAGYLRVQVEVFVVHQVALEEFQAA